MNERIYMGQHYVRPGCGAYFVNEERSICRQIIDPWGNFRVFPGIAPDERLEREYPTFDGAPVLRQEIRFGECDGRILAVWTIRTDGLEEMDDFGFGAEDWESLRLYAYLTENGEFDGPFRLYAIGNRLFSDYAFADDIRRARG